jgi:hypothetical protein
MRRRRRDPMSALARPAAYGLGAREGLALQQQQE